MFSRRMNMPAAIVSIGIHSAFVLALAHISPSPRIISDKRDEIYLVNLVTPQVEHISLGTITQRKRHYLKPQLNPISSLIKTTNARPLAASNTSLTSSQKITFAPKLKNNQTTPLIYKHIAARPVPNVQGKQIAMLSLNNIATDATLSKSSLPPLQKKRNKIMTGQKSSNELLAYQQAIISKILASKIYPLKAMNRGHEGVICLRFLISENGELKDVELANRSEYTLLNQAALDTIKIASPFQPLPSSLKQDKLWLNIAISFTLAK